MLKKLKLCSLTENCLKEKEMCSIQGGFRECGCSCAYEDPKLGGSTSEQNMNANYNLGPTGGYSTTGCNQYMMSDQPGSYLSPGSLNESVNGF